MYHTWFQNGTIFGKDQLGHLGEEHLEIMAQKACRKGCIAGFKTLYAEDVKKIYEMCL